MAVEMLSQKLLHPLEEVRQRSARSLHSKLDAGLFTLHELTLEPTLPLNLLRLLESPDAGGKVEAVALLARLAAHSSTSKQLAGLGAVAILQRVQADNTQTVLHEGATAAVEELLRQHDGAVLTIAAESDHTPPPPPQPVVRTQPRPNAAPGASRALKFGTEAPAPPQPSSTSALVLSVAPPPLACRRLGATPLDASDEQMLFEATVRLSMAEERVLLNACHQLATEVAYDLPAGSLIHRPELLQGLVSLLRTTDVAEHSELAAGALHALDVISQQIVAALRLQADHELQAARASPQQHENRRPASTASNQTPSDLAETSSGVSGSDGGGGGGGGASAGRWEVWQLADAVWSTATPLLRRLEMAPRVCRLLVRLLPLLYLPPAQDEDAETAEAAAALWRGHFEALCAVLRFHRLIPSAAAADAEFEAAWPELQPTQLALLLLTLLMASTLPPSLLRAAAPPAIATLLRGLAADPFIAICQPSAHRLAQRCLRELDPAAARAAAAASRLEAAAAAARVLVGRELSRGGELGQARGALAGNDPGALDGRRSELARCLPALSYHDQPQLLQLLVRLCSASGARPHVDETQPLLLGCLGHPRAAVREATLTQILVALWRPGESPPAASAAAFVAVEHAAAAEGDDGDAADADTEVALAAAEASDELRPLSRHLLRPATLALLVRVALHASPVPTQPSGTAAPSASRLAQLAHAVLMAALPLFSAAEVCGIAPMLPLMQATLYQPGSAPTEDFAVPPNDGEALPVPEAAFHARTLLGAVLPQLPLSTRFGSSLRMLLHSAEPLAAHATEQLAQAIAPPPAFSLDATRSGAALHPSALPPPGADGWPSDASHPPAAHAASTVQRASFDGVEVARLLQVVANRELEARFRAAAAEQLAMLCGDAAVRAHALRAQLLPLLLTELEDGLYALDEGTGAAGEDAALSFGTSLLRLLATVVERSGAVREAMLGSLGALQLMATVALHANAAVRRAVRSVLGALLFEPGSLAAAAAASAAVEAAAEAGAAEADDESGWGLNLPADTLARLADAESATVPAPIATSLAVAFWLPRRVAAGEGEDASAEMAEWCAVEAADAAQALCVEGGATSLAARCARATQPSGALASTLRCRRALREARGEAGELVAVPSADEEVTRAVARAVRLEPREAMAAALTALDACTDHAQCAVCLEQLELACVTHAQLRQLGAPRHAAAPHPLLALLRQRAGSARPGAVFRLLGVPPATDADDALLAQLLVLLEGVLRTDAADAADAADEGGADPLLQRLLLALTGGGFEVLDRADEPKSAPRAAGGATAPRSELRVAVLQYGVALLARFPSLGVEVRRAGPLLPMLCEQYGAAQLTATVPPQLRRLALHLACCCLQPAAPAGVRIDAESAVGEAPAVAERVAALLPALIPATAAANGARSVQGVAARRLAMCCVHGALELAAPHGAAMARLWAHGTCWLLPLLGDADPRVAASAFEIAAVLASAHGSDAHLARQTPELLSAAARVGLATSETGAVDAACLPRAAALRLLQAMCDAAAAASGEAEAGADADAEADAEAEAEAEAADGASKMWEAMSALGVPQRLPSLLGEPAPSAGLVRAACELLHALLRLRPAPMLELLLGDGAPDLGALLRWLDVRQHWLAYTRAQAAAARAHHQPAGAKAPLARPAAPAQLQFGVVPEGGGADAGAVSAPLGRLQGAEWLSRALPRVQLARAALLRLLRAMLAADPATVPLAKATSLLRKSGAQLLPALLPLLADPLATATPCDDEAEPGGAARPGPPGTWEALVAMLRRPAQAQARAAVEGAGLELMHEAMLLWRELMRRTPPVRVFLLGAAVAPTPGARAPWALSLVRCLRRAAPLALRLEACRLLRALFDGADGLGVALDAPPSGGAAAAADGGDDGNDDDGGNADGADGADGALPAAAAGDALALELLRLHDDCAGGGAGEVEAAAQPLVLGALRGLVALSRAAKLRVLQRGFVPQLLARLDDLRAFVALPHAAGHHPHAAAAAAPAPAPAAFCGSAAAAARAKAEPAARRWRGGSEAAPPPLGALGVQPGEAAARRAELLPQLVGCVSLLANLLAHCEEAKLACVALQLPLLLLRLWPLSAAAPELREAALRCLCNYVAHCAPAKCSLTAYSDAKGRCLAVLLVRLVSRPRRASQPPLPERQWALGWALLQSLATAAESRSVLLRCQAAPRAVAALRASLARPAVDEARAAAVLDFLANLCFDAEGQAALLRVPDAFDGVVDGVGCRLPAARRAAALCLRNLAFCADGKASFLAKPRALPALLHALGGADARLASHASAALWALLCRCEKAKVAMRGSTLLQQLQVAEKALAARALVPGGAEGGAAAQDDLAAALRNLDAVGWLLGLDGMTLRFGAAGP